MQTTSQQNTQVAGTKEESNSRWSLFVAALSVLLAYSLPLEQMAFQAKLTHPTLFFLRWLGYAVFASDVVFRWRRGTYRHGGRDRGWLLLDILSCIPVGPILFAVWQHAPHGLLLIAHVLPILRLVRTYVMVRHWQQALPKRTGMRRIATTLVIISLLVHWIGCWQMAVYQQDAGTSFPMRYLQAVYWTVTTMTTVGYGDITPDKSQATDLLFTILIMVIGAGAFGFIIGNIATIMSNLDFARNQHLDKMQRINAFLTYHKMPDSLIERVHGYHSYLWRTRKGFDESAILADLPPTIRADVEMHLRRDIVSKVPFFRDASSEMLYELVKHLKPLVAIPGEKIIRRGDLGDAMFFISNGEVHVMAPDGKTPLATLTDGSFFGEIALIEQCPRGADVLAVSYCDLYSLERSALETVMQQHPEFGRHIGTMAAQRKSNANTSVTL